LSPYTGQTVRVRFRFISDYNTTDDGWYIDDVEFGWVPGIAEKSQKLPIANIVSHANPVSKIAEFHLSAPKTANITLKIYDTSGKLVKILSNLPGETEIVWNLSDTQGRTVKSGIYFVRFVSKDQTTINKLVVAK
jgi:hypothetical protein